MMARIFCLFIIACVSISSCKSPEARRPVQSTSGSFIKESAERNKKIYEVEKAVIQKIMDANAGNSYIASDSGFWYFYNTKQDSVGGQMPKFGDDITFTYDVKELNGTEVFTTEEKGLHNYKVDQSNQELISGLRDGLKLMKVGETVTFLFPSYKAYGYYGIVDKLGTNVPVQSKVTLKSIEQTQEN